MRVIRQLLGGIALATTSLGLILGGFSLALAEGLPQTPRTPPATASPTPTAPPSLPPTPPIPGPTAIIPSPTPSPTPTIAPPTTCPPPAGWIQILVQPGDTLESLAARYRTTPEELMQANCLLSPSLPVGYAIFVPPIPTPTPVPCGPPPGWIRYTVQPGDNLFRIGFNHYTTYTALQQANCLSGTTIYPGQVLWVPNVATRTPVLTDTPTATASPTATQTATPGITPTPGVTESPPTGTSTPSPTATTPPSATPATPSPSPTSTNTPTATPTPTTPSPTATESGQSVQVEILSCTSSVDITHQMGEVTNADVRLTNLSDHEIFNLCATISASDEESSHPDKTHCLASLASGAQSTFRLTADTLYGQTTTIQVLVTAPEGIYAIASESNCP